MSASTRSSRQPDVNRAVQICSTSTSRRTRRMNSHVRRRDRQMGQGRARRRHQDRVNSSSFAAFDEVHDVDESTRHQTIGRSRAVASRALVAVRRRGRCAARAWFAGGAGAGVGDDRLHLVPRMAVPAECVMGLVATFYARQAPGFRRSLVSAVLGIAVGLILLVAAGGAISLTLLLIVFFVMEGVATIMYALDHRRELSGRWGLLLVSGAVDLVLAAMILAGLPGTSLGARPPGRRQHDLRRSGAGRHGAVRPQGRTGLSNSRPPSACAGLAGDALALAPRGCTA